MNKKQLASNISVSLAGGPWFAEHLKHALFKRLPTPLHRLCDPLARELITRLPSLYAPKASVISDTLQQLHGLNVIYRYCHRYQIWPNIDLTPPQMAPIATFASLDIPPIPTLKDLAEWLTLPPERLDYFADPEARQENNAEIAINNYHYSWRAKKNQGTRLIEAPKPNLKLMQRQVLHRILDHVPTHPDAFGFVRGRNCLDAARRHAGEEVVIRFDLKTFFPSISAGRIYGLFRCLGYPNNVARYLTGICTTKTPHWVVERLPYEDRHIFRQKHLPQGSPASPALANLAAHTLDRRLSALARTLGASYSRYADDLSFSGAHSITRPILRHVPLIISNEGFHLNHAKTRVMPATARQTITGIVVNRHLNIARKDYDRLKAIIHTCNHDNPRWRDDAAFRAKLLGQIAWVEAVNPRRGQKLRARLEAKAG